MWETSTIESTGDVGNNSSIAVDSNDDLKYATNKSGSWVITTADNTGYVGSYNSISIDSNNKVHISYYDGLNYDLKYATNVQPIPDIKANGSDGPVTIATGDNLIVTVALDPAGNDGQPADWYVYAPVSPFGPYYYIYPGGWVPGSGVTYSGPLFNLNPYEVLNMTGLPIGIYTICFDVDTGTVYSDCVDVTIQ